MKSVKEIVAALSKEENVTVKRNVTFKRCTPGEVDENTGACKVAVTLTEEVPYYVQVDQRMIDEAEAIADAAEKAAKADDATDEMKAEAENARAYADSIELDSWVKGMSNVIWITNFDIIGSLADNPETVWLADYLRDNPEDIKPVMNSATGSLILEEVEEGTEYYKPFSNRRTATDVPHDSIYATPFNIKLSKYGWEEAEEIREILREIKKEKIKNRRLAATRRSRHAEVDDAED